MTKHTRKTLALAVAATSGAAVSTAVSAAATAQTTTSATTNAAHLASTSKYVKAIKPQASPAPVSDEDVRLFAAGLELALGGSQHAAGDSKNLALLQTAATGGDGVDKHSMNSALQRVNKVVETMLKEAREQKGQLAEASDAWSCYYDKANSALKPYLKKVERMAKSLEAKQVV